VCNRILKYIIIDEMIKTAIHREVSGFYFSRSIPTTDKILAVVNDELNLSDYDWILVPHKVGFQFVKSVSSCLKSIY
jgi:hypothetical protein